MHVFFCFFEVFNNFSVLLQFFTLTHIVGLRLNCLAILARWMEPF